MSGVKDYQLNIKTYLITILDDINNIIKELNDDDTSREVLLDIEVTIENETLDKLTHINNIIDYINHYLVNLIPRENPLTNEEYVYILEFLYIFYKYIVSDLDSLEKMGKLIDLFDKDDITLPKLEIIITDIKKSAMLDVPKNKFINDLVSNFSINKLEKIESMNYHDYIDKKIKLIDLLNILSSTIKSKSVTQSVTQPDENYQTYNYNLDYIENIISILKSIKGHILQYLINTNNTKESNTDIIINDLNIFKGYNITYDTTENIKKYIETIISAYGQIEENIKNSNTNGNLDHFNVLDDNLNNILEAYIGNKYINISENKEELKLVYKIPEPTLPSVVQQEPTLPIVVQPSPTLPSVSQPSPTVPSVVQQVNQQGNQQQIIQSKNPEILKSPETKQMPSSTNFIEPSNTENQPLNIQSAPQQQAPAAQLPQQPNTPNQFAGDLPTFIKEIKTKPEHVDLL